MAALAASHLINRLTVIGAGLTCAADYDLATLADEPNFGGAFRAGFLDCLFNGTLFGDGLFGRDFLLCYCCHWFLILLN